jgi:D-3-phosphoglycerate dehydrogenase
MLQALRHRANRSSGQIGSELRGKHVRILGFGRIGRQVSKLARDFGAIVHCVGPEWRHFKFSEGSGDWCRIVSIHADLNPTSKGMVNAEFLSKLKPGAIVVNTARHAIVDGNAVVEWLKRDRQAIYANDFRGDLENCFVEAEAMGQIISTPHIGGWTIESLHKTEELLAEKVIEWAKQHAEQTKTVSPIG